jgi:hypothetical protein
MLQQIAYNTASISVEAVQRLRGKHICDSIYAVAYRCDICDSIYAVAYRCAVATAYML